MSLRDTLIKFQNRRALKAKQRAADEQQQLKIEELEQREVLSTLPAYHLDFGTNTSPVATDYTRVARWTYSATRGFGWQSISGISAFDRGGVNALTCDGHRGQSATFLVDLPSGEYQVLAVLGDAKALRDRVAVLAEGQQMASEVTTGVGQFKEVTFTVKVTDGKLNLQFVDRGGKNPYFSLAALNVDPTVAPPPPPPPGTGPVVVAGPDLTGFEGAVVNFSGTATGTGLTHRWDFGDGTSSTGSSTASHSYADDGVYAATLTVTDSLGRTASDTANVTVNNVQPTATFSDNNPVNEGSAVTVSFTNQNDAPADMAAGFRYSYDFNNDGVFEMSNVTNASAVYTVVDNGNTTVRGRITDQDGAFTDYTTVVEANNVAPTATFSNNGPVAPGSAVTVSFTNQADASSADGAAGFRYSYDFNNDGTFEVANVTTASASHTFASAGTYVVRGQITDKDGGSRDYTTTVTVNGTTALRTFYVSASGSDSANGSSASPWRSLQFAANQVRPGDTVIVRAGSYSGFNLVASGTAANRITFSAEPGAVINTPLSLSGNLYGINGSGKEYLTIDGFTFTPQTGQGEWYTAIRLGGTPGAWVRGNIIRNNTAQMRVVGQAATPDKYGFYTSWNDGLLVENNTVSGTYNSGIYTANSARNYIIRGNHVLNGGGNGIHNNGDLGAGGPGIIYNALIENNVIHNVGFGIGGQAISCDGVQNSRIQNNLLYDIHAKGISLYATNGAAGSRFNFVVNNTVLVAADGQVPLRINHNSSNNVVLNNIFQAATSSRAWVDGEESGLVGSTIDYNVTTGVALVGGVRRTDWGSSYGFDTHSVISTPTALFVNAAGNDYHLIAGSPAIDVGTATQAPAKDRDGKSRPSGAGMDIGAYEF